MVEEVVVDFYMKSLLACMEVVSSSGFECHLKEGKQSLLWIYLWRSLVLFPRHLHNIAWTAQCKTCISQMIHNIQYPLQVVLPNNSKSMESFSARLTDEHGLAPTSFLLAIYICICWRITLKIKNDIWKNTCNYAKLTAVATMLSKETGLFPATCANI